MKSQTLAGLPAAVLSASLIAGAPGEVVVTAGSAVPVAEAVAVLCTSKDAGNFRSYPLRAGMKPVVAALSWQLPQEKSVVIPLSEDAASRMRLVTLGASHSPRAIGDDDPPPPPPGTEAAPTDHWAKVSALPAYKEGGRFLMMSANRPRDFLFELPAASGPAEALVFEAVIDGKEHALRCDLRP